MQSHSWLDTPLTSRSLLPLLNGRILHALMHFLHLFQIQHRYHTEPTANCSDVAYLWLTYIYTTKSYTTSQVFQEIISLDEHHRKRRSYFMNEWDVEKSTRHSFCNVPCWTENPVYYYHPAPSTDNNTKHIHKLHFLSFTAAVYHPHPPNIPSYMPPKQPLNSHNL